MWNKMFKGNGVGKGGGWSAAAPITRWGWVQYLQSTKCKEVTSVSAILPESLIWKCHYTKRIRLCLTVCCDLALVSIPPRFVLTPFFVPAFSRSFVTAASRPRLVFCTESTAVVCIFSIQQPLGVLPAQVTSDIAWLLVAARLLTPRRRPSRSVLIIRLILCRYSSRINSRIRLLVIQFAALIAFGGGLQKDSLITIRRIGAIGSGY